MGHTRWATSASVEHGHRILAYRPECAHPNITDSVRKVTKKCHFIQVKIGCLPFIVATLPKSNCVPHRGTRISLPILSPLYLLGGGGAFGPRLRGEGTPPATSPENERAGYLTSQSQGGCQPRLSTAEVTNRPKGRRLNRRAGWACHGLQKQRSFMREADEGTLS